MLAALNDLQTRYLSADLENDVFHELLSLALDATASRSGLIAEMARFSFGTSELTMLASAADTADGDLLDAAAECLKGSEPVLRSTVSEKGAPIEILCMPLVGSGQTVGVLALAGRDAGYDTAMIEAIGPLLAAAAGIARSEHINRTNTDMRAQLLKEKESALKANRIKSEFMSSVSHNLRTPLNAIIGFSDLLGQEIFGPVGSEQNREYLSLIHNSGRDLLVLVDRLLELEKLDRLPAAREIPSIDASNLISALAEKFAGDAAASSIEVEHRIAPDLPLVKAEPEALTTIFENLTHNALKFTPENGVITIGLERMNGAHVVLSVTDTGPGFAADAIESLGMPFVVEDAFVTAHGKGAGLGLALSKRFAESLGGTLSVDTAQASGARVTVVLKLDPDAVESA